jgi:predicted nucleotidyltransferase
MMDKDEILKVLKDHKETLLSKYPIRSIGLFGSISRNDDTSQSDIDIVVEFDGQIGIQFIDLAEEFESLLHRNVDLVSKNAIKPRYYQSIKDDIIYV